MLGPLLRYVDQTAATFWVEADRACEVQILGHRARTFEVAGHHYALVVADGLAPASEVCSPFHQAMSRSLRRMHRLATSRAGELGGVALARLAGARRPGIRWRVTRGPWFQNMLCTLEYDGGRARARFDRAVREADGTPVLEPAETVPITEC